MPSSQSDWDAKYNLAKGTPPEEPASIVRELLPLLPRGAALDVASGPGRHASLLAGRGQSVTAVDWSGAALNLLETRARQAHIPAGRIGKIVELSKSPHAGIDIMQADLERPELAESSFDLILCIHYLQRSLFPQFERALRPGGVLLFETYTRAQLEFMGGPRNPQNLLEPGELRNSYPELRVLFYRELRAGQGIASRVAQKPSKKI